MSAGSFSCLRLQPPRMLARASDNLRGCYNPPQKRGPTDFPSVVGVAMGEDLNRRRVDFKKDGHFKKEQHPS